MKFIARRTSIHSDESSPIEGAVREPSIRVDIRTVDDPSKLHFAQERDHWYDSGRNHRVLNGQIARDFDSEEWFIEINSLGQLIELIDKEGELVIGRSWNNPETFQIEVYDDYRE